MKKRKRLPRLLHAVICLGLVLLGMTCIRFTCGPSNLLTEKQALRRAQRQSLREPQKAAARVERRNLQDFFVWDGAGVQSYYALWNRPGRRGYGYNAGGETGLRLMGTPLLREYSWCHLWSDSGRFGWGCPGNKLTTYEDVEGHWVQSDCLPLAVINEDPAAASGVLTVSGRTFGDGYIAFGGNEYRWTAASQRKDPHFFIFQLTGAGDESALEARWVLGAISAGEDPYGWGTTASAEVIWCDENGNELYRQQIELLDQGEGSEEYGA